MMVCFCEGPVWDKRHNQLLFSDTGADIEHGQTDGLTTFRKPSFSGTVTYSTPGAIFTRTHETRAISKTLTVSVRFW